MQLTGHITDILSRRLSIQSPALPIPSLTLKPMGKLIAARYWRLATGYCPFSTVKLYCNLTHPDSSA